MFAPGSESVIIEFPVFDSSSSTGALLTGLAYNTGSLVAYYDRWGAAGGATQISLVTMTKGTWTSGGFVAVDGTNFTGVYQLCIPNAALAAGVNGVTIKLSGAANMVPKVIDILLNMETATSIVDAIDSGEPTVTAAVDTTAIANQVVSMMDQ